ncbi:pimeloyl-[acyl-carrier protein] methyl ester esterase [Rhodoblastus acidophilus]|uniref:alpha/beta fold hydrolase n=1 Tax=Rhodoblastus acidophilus TaxID=1074 RepID=UPI0022259F8D|nr:alpha/beta hydrolase [Rhodoblastus acidophilus]MCW2283130.1 pimeloyl-[acyl-carrier protein] methyl ester esterase [Rhodoblastus acidophilus]MCW2331819.1 pimeloyl-[acyl-carrier protein] methyl ester esterase [Rhodoblastus acidophilus]
MRLYFVHGWAFAPECFDALAPKLADWPQVRADLGFFGPKHIPDFAPGDVLVGHSMGLGWGFSQRADWAGVVAINAFSRFVKDEHGRGCVRASELRALRKNLARDPKACVDAFRAQHGGGTCSTPNPESLAEGLAFLETCDAHIPRHCEEPTATKQSTLRASRSVDCFAEPVIGPAEGRTRWLAMTAADSAARPPTLVLAAEDDPLVPLDAARELAQSGGELFVSATGGHGLPWTAPAFCAEKLRDFLSRHGG